MPTIIACARQSSLLRTALVFCLATSLGGCVSASVGTAVISTEPDGALVVDSRTATVSTRLPD